jgi:hypothetical protein
MDGKLVFNATTESQVFLLPNEEMGVPHFKPFVYHYDTDDNGRLILGDGSDE